MKDTDENTITLKEALEKGDIEIDRYIDSQIDMQMDRQIEKQIERKIVRKTEGYFGQGVISLVLKN